MSFFPYRPFGFCLAIFASCLGLGFHVQAREETKEWAVAQALGSAKKPASTAKAFYFVRKLSKERAGGYALFHIENSVTVKADVLRRFQSTMRRAGWRQISPASSRYPRPRITCSGALWPDKEQPIAGAVCLSRMTDGYDYLEGRRVVEKIGDFISAEERDVQYRLATQAYGSD